MIRAYYKDRAFYVAEDFDQLALEEAVWLDLYHPTADEERFLEDALGFKLPTREEMKDIEPSSRMYTEEGVHYMTAGILFNGDTDAPQTTDVSFILHGHLLVTVRYADLKPFQLFQTYADKHTDLYRSGPATLVSLLEAIVDRGAEVLERVGTAIDIVSVEIFARHQDAIKRRSDIEMERSLAEVALNKNLTVKVRDSLLSLGRVISFLSHTDEISQDKRLVENLSSVARDVHALADHTNFLASNISFMLDACLGFISIQQNAIIKIFSIAAVVLLPPTLVASIYGMNFKYMPELDQPYGYPMALGLMAISALTPYLWFKRRGWL
jgi:magnesium transporter